MRVLTTAINQGEHKVPEGHKVTRYALAPGAALRLAPEPREPIKVNDTDVRAATYLHLLSWVEGRTVAHFALRGMVIAQPTKDDPAPKRERKIAGTQAEVGRDELRNREDAAGPSPASVTPVKKAGKRAPKPLFLRPLRK